MNTASLGYTGNKHTQCTEAHTNHNNPIGRNKVTMTKQLRDVISAEGSTKQMLHHINGVPWCAENGNSKTGEACEG